MTIPSSLQSYSFLNFDHKQCFESHNTSSLRDLLAKQNYHAVINSSKLFWQTFCLGACRIDKSENDFKFEEVNGCLSISGNPLRIKDLKLCLEDIREVFMENLHATKGFKITAYEFKIISTQIILKNFQPIIDHNFLNSHNKIHLSDFQNLIKPTMKAFCELIGANCKETIDSINYVLNDKSTTIEDTSFNIKLKNHLSYDLEPQKISKRKNQNIELYRLYQQQMLCDLKINANDGAVALASTQVYLYGGDVFKAMLMHETQESHQKVVNLTLFSLKTIKFFIDFLYFGGEINNRKYEDLDVDLIEAFNFAHTYQITELFDCCANIYCRSEISKDPETLQNLIAAYDNEQLKKLYNELFLKPDADKSCYIKV